MSKPTPPPPCSDPPFPALPPFLPARAQRAPHMLQQFAAPPPQMTASDGPGHGASTTGFRFSGYPSRARCDPDGAAVPLP